MLVLSRKLGESIKIGDNIYVEILRMGRGQVKLGSDAPVGVKVLRTEIIDRPPRNVADMIIEGLTEAAVLAKINTHADLVEACKAALSYIKTPLIERRGLGDQVKKQLNAALAKAEAREEERTA